MSNPRIIPAGAVLPPMSDGRPMPEQAEGCDRKSNRRHQGRFGVLNNFVDFTLRVLNRSDIAVWLVLYRDSRDGVARVSQSHIAERAGVHVSTIKRAIGRLKARELVAVVHQGGLNRGVSSYRVDSLEQGSQE